MLATFIRSRQLWVEAGYAFYGRLLNRWSHLSGRALFRKNCRTMSLLKIRSSTSTSEWVFQRRKARWITALSRYLLPYPQENAVIIFYVILAPCQFVSSHSFRIVCSYVNKRNYDTWLPVYYGILLRTRLCGPTDAHIHRRSSCAKHKQLSLVPLL